MWRGERRSQRSRAHDGRGGRKAAEGVGGKRPGGIPSEQEFDPPAAEAMKKIFSAKIQDPSPSIQLQVATDRKNDFSVKVWTDYELKVQNTNWSAWVSSSTMN